MRAIWYYVKITNDNMDANLDVIAKETQVKKLYKIKKFPTHDKLFFLDFTTLSHE